MVFRRRRTTEPSSPEPSSPEPSSPELTSSEADGPTGPEATDMAAVEQAAVEQAGVAGAPAERAGGPWDISEVDDPGAGGRLPLGSMWLPGVEGMEVRVEVDEEAGRIMAVTVVMPELESALQIQPFAAPRTAGLWDEIRADIATGVQEQGGATTETPGPFGTELRAEIPVQLPDGTPAVQAARFVGVDGPRWFLRGVVTGRAFEDAEAAAPLEYVFGETVVVRGDAPMARGELLELTLPVEPGAESPDDEAEPEGEDRPSLRPFERGPEITEVR